MSDLFSDLPQKLPSRLERARRALAKAQTELERAERAQEELPICIRRYEDAVAAARHELARAEMERIGQ